MRVILPPPIFKQRIKCDADLDPEKLFAMRRRQCSGFLRSVLPRFTAIA